jgi:hypothetical protein
VTFRGLTVARARVVSVTFCGLLPVELQGKVTLRGPSFPNDLGLFSRDRMKSDVLWPAISSRLQSEDRY